MLWLLHIDLLATTLSLEKVLGYLSVTLVGTVKFWLSIIMALSLEYNALEVFLSGSFGAILGVWVFTFFGTEIRKWLDRRFPRKRQMSFRRRRKIVQFWRKYGVWGVAFMGPVLSPPVSVGVAIAFREHPRRIIMAMTVSILFWTTIFVSFRDLMLNVVDKIS